MNKQETLLGLERIKLDLLFILAGGEKVEKNFTYIQQRNYYMKEIFGSTDNEKDIIAYGKQPHKLAYEYMFPNNPRAVRNFKLLVRAFAVQFLLDKMFSVKDYDKVIDEFFIRDVCENRYHFPNSDMDEIFVKEIEELHPQYIKDFSIEDYKKFELLMTKFDKQFHAVADAIENQVTSSNERKPFPSAERKTFPSLERMKIDLLFILAGGEKVEKNFTYDQQRDYYLQEIFGDIADAKEIVSYGKQYKLASEYMFPNKPANINNRKYFFEFLADCIFINQIYLTDSYSLFKEKAQLQKSCFEEFVYKDEDAEEIFKNEIRLVLNKYSRSITAEEYQSFLDLLKKFYEPFNKILKAFKAVATDKCTDKAFKAVTTDKPTVKANDKADSFSVLCRKFEIAPDNTVIFKLKVDALAEIQIGNNTYIDYFESLQNSWREKAFKYDYCEELENYIRQEKYACLLAFGNKLNLIRMENILFELLASVRVKLVLSDGASNLAELKAGIAKRAEEFSNDKLKNAFIESTKKVIAYYSLNDDANYNAKIKEELVPYRAGLIYAKDILMEEINRRDKKNSAAKQPHDDDKTLESEVAKYEQKYDLIISQKDAEIDALKRDLEYYENIKSQEFRSDFSRYDEALMVLFQRMCEIKYGAPLNELYLMSRSEKEIQINDIKNIVKNLLFIFDSIGIHPYEEKNLGKMIKFDSEDANVVYRVDEEKITDGINQGLLKYPGWEQRGKEIVLPLVVMKTGGDSDE